MAKWQITIVSEDQSILGHLLQLLMETDFDVGVSDWDTPAIQVAIKTSPSQFFRIINSLPGLTRMTMARVKRDGVVMQLMRVE